MDFHGVKVAVLVGDKLLMHLRDDKPGLFNANMWDFPGGGREGNETPEECAIREIKEEFGIDIVSEVFVWKKEYPAQKDPNQKAVFMVAMVPEDVIKNIKLTEGQRWSIFDQETFFQDKNVIEALKSRFKDYLESLNSTSHVP